MIHSWNVGGLEIGIDLEKWNACIATHQTRDCFGAEKYFHLHSQVVKFADLAISAGLTGGGLKVLDIASGAGVWGAVLQSLGYNVTLADKSDRSTEFYRDAVAALGLRRTVSFHYSHISHKFTADPLPADIGMFDVISAIACAPMSTWGEREYRIFIGDCGLHLNPGGFVLLSPNKTGRESELHNILKPEDARKTEKLTWYKINKGEEV